ncbi:MAG TPA: aminotransferase class I/II-fold pyridoxal phosphate-dependent enzyme, partial [Roseiflexaceae bacterium]
MNIPLVDLKAQYRAIKDEVDAAMRRVLESTAFILGQEVARFEQEFAAFCEARYVVGISSGTDALHLVLKVCGVGPGDEVITTPFTFIATAEAISLTGARPVFVDVREETMLIDPDAVEAAITPRT